MNKSAASVTKEHVAVAEHFIVGKHGLGTRTNREMVLKLACLISDREAAAVKRIIDVVNARVKTDAEAYERDQYLIRQLRRRLACATRNP